MRDRCMLCHRKLKDIESKSRGLGPVCWGKLVKLDKQEKAKRKARREERKVKIQVLEGQVNMFEGE